MLVLLKTIVLDEYKTILKGAFVTEIKPLIPISIKALKNSSKQLPNLHRDREHGTLFIRQNPDIYRIINLEASDAHRRPELSLEVDTLEDLEVISAIITHFEGRLDYSLS